MTNSIQQNAKEKAETVRCYIPTESKHYTGPDKRTVVEWSEYPPNHTQEMWDEQGPDCLRNLLVVVKPEDAERIAKEKASSPNNCGGFARIYRQWLEIYAHDRGTALGHWEYAAGDCEEISADKPEGSAK